MMGNRSPWQRLRRIFQRDPVAEVDDELSHHLEQRVHDYVARGMEPELARKAAFERLGDLERVRSECTGSLAAERRAEERRIRLSISWLDVKLGVRMLVKYPGLSLVAVIGMALATAIGAGSFAAIYSMMDPMLPLDEGDRIVAIQNNRADSPGNPDRQALHDFVLWRDELNSVRDLSAFRYDKRNLSTADGSTELVWIAEMTASGFRVARVPPLLGRPLVAEDEHVGAPPVIVIAYEEWQRRFDGDPDIIGRPVRLGGVVHTVVGVMPEAFRFPLFHRYWIPLRLNPSDYERGGGPAIHVFGRLADGVTLGQAQTELTTIGRRIAATFPDTHEHLRPRIMPYTYLFFGLDLPLMQWALHVFQLVISLMLVLVSANVGVLVYARTTTRAGEIAVRSTLGASRRRVVTQLFVEALVMSLAAAAVGLTIAGAGLAWVQNLFERLAGDEIYFWFGLGLSPGLLVYVAGLAVLAGVIVGVVPALKATGRRVQSGLAQLSSRGSQMQLGRTWTALIVVQVATAVAVLPSAIHYVGMSVRSATHQPGFAAEEFLFAKLALAHEETPPAAEAEAQQRAFESQFAERSAALIRRLDAEPAISVTFSSDGSRLRVEVDDTGTQTENDVGPATDQGSAGHPARINHVDVDFFDVFDVPVLAGRGFDDTDTNDGSTAVIVNRTFAERILGGADVLGRRIRAVGQNEADPGAVENRRYEIVGIVPDFPNPGPFEHVEPYLYQPVAPGQIQSVRLSVRVRGGSTAGFAARLRDITAAVDPNLELHDLRNVAEDYHQTNRIMRMIAAAIAAVALSILLLSVAGIYAMLSFTVARRRREIGIRSALGADPRRVLSGIFARASAQLGMGVTAGLILATALEWGTGGWVMGGQAFVLLPAVSALIIVVGLLAAVGPARRGLAIQPSEALRSE